MKTTKPRFGSRHLAPVIFLGSAALAAATASVAANNDKYPRLAIISTGGPQKYASSFQTYAAKFNVVIINGGYEGWQRGAGYSKEQVIGSIKGQSRVGTRVYQYIALNEVYNSANASSNPFATWYKQIVAKKWWLYPSGTAGTPVVDPQSTQKWLMNMGPNVPVDGATGLGPYAWGAKYVNDLFHLGRYAGTSAAPSLDGFFLDNVMIDPSNGAGNMANGDWVRNGNTQAHNAPSTYAAVMAGEKQFFSYLDTAWPGSQQLGNAGATFALALNNYYGTNPTLNSQVLAGTSPLSGVMEGGTIEHAIGKSFSIEAYGGSAKLQQWYQIGMKNFGGSKLLILSQGSVQANGSDPLAFSGGKPSSWSPAWQGARYGIAATLMNNGYYCPDYGSYDEETAANRRWFDEFDNAGAGEGYLGNPTATAAGNPQTGAWSNGVWKREFQYGVVLWNPKGNGTRTVNVAGLVSPHGLTGLKHINGRLEHTVNNGLAATSVTLRDRDGVILLWTRP